jgi:hypothetical protein
MPGVEWSSGILIYLGLASFILWHKVHRRCTRAEVSDPFQVWVVFPLHTGIWTCVSWSRCWVICHLHARSHEELVSKCDTEYISLLKSFVWNLLLFSSCIMKHISGPYSCFSSFIEKGNEVNCHTPKHLLGSVFGYVFLAFKFLRTNYSETCNYISQKWNLIKYPKKVKARGLIKLFSC